MRIGSLIKVWEDLDARIETGTGRKAALGQARLALLTSSLVLVANLCIGMKSGLAGWLRLSGLGYWSWWCASHWLFLVLIPWLVARYAFGMDPMNFGFRLKDARGNWKIYGAILVFGFLGVFISSRFGQFSVRYPLFKEASQSWSILLMWELIYALQFVAIEFFFRGFILKTCERAMGSLSIFVMVIPYCLIHATKPWPEFVGSIMAGLVLGTLAMATRSLWGGVILHITVAWSLDFVILIQNGKLPTEWLTR